MNRITKLVVLVFAALIGSSLSAQAGVTPVGFALAHKIEFPPSDFNIVGVRASALWGVHRNVYGLDIGGVGNITDQSFAGIGISGGFNMVRGDATIVGLQAAGIFNDNQKKVHGFGLQVAGAVNSNQGEARFVGFQIATIANLSPHMNIVGAQVGLYNKAHEVYGLQIGLINSCDQLHGVQIGLVNYNARGLFAVAPILNIGF